MTIRSTLGLYRDRWMRTSLRQRSPVYWQIRSRLARIKFDIARRGFGVRDFGRGTAEAASTSVQILRAIASPSLVAVLTVAVLTFLGIELRALAIPPAWLARVGRLVGGRGNANAQVSLYGTVAQISGVFLGLYFTALSVVASTSYRDVPADLRSAVVDERAGTIYLKVLAFTGAASLLCLGELMAGWSPGLLNGALVAVCSAASVLSFVLLGTRVFTFFDPSSVAGHLTSQIINAARASTPHGYGWHDRSFQNHQYRIASRAATALHSLTGVTATGTNSASSIAAVANRALLTLLAYDRIKPNIPVRSYWFERIAKHESWLTASGTSIDLAVRNRVGIQPKAESDDLWLEAELSDVTHFAMQVLIERGEYGEAANVLQVVLRCVDALAERFQLETAVHLHDRLLLLLPLMIRGRELGPDATRPNRHKEIHRATVIDGLIAAPCVIVAATGRAASKLSSESILHLVARRKRQRARDPLAYAVPVGVRRSLRWFGDALDFERGVEGDVVTADWYLNHCVARDYCLDLRRIFDTLLTMCEGTYGSLNERNEPFAHLRPEDGVNIVERGREACDKLRAHCATFHAAIERLEALRCKFDEKDWPSIDVAAGDARTQNLEAVLLRALARLGPALPATPPTGRLPDSLGYALTTLGDAALFSLLNGEHDLFAQLFEPYLLLAFQAHDRARLELAQHDADTQIRVMLDLLVEAAALSGYAYVVSHSIGGPAWDAARAAWDRLLTRVQDPTRLLSLLLVADDARMRSLVTITPRELLRTRWHQAFTRTMEAKHFITGGFGYGRGESKSVRSEAIDPLTNVFLRSPVAGPDAQEVFFVGYVTQRVEAAGLTLPQGARELITSRDRIVAWRLQATRDGSGPLGDRQHRAR
jgi:hypothetical protein